MRVSRKRQAQQQNDINNKLTVPQEQHTTAMAPPKPQTWAAMAANAQSQPLLYNKNNRILLKLNDSYSVEDMTKKAPEEVVHRIDAYLTENNIATTKLRAAQNLPSRDIAIKTTREEEAEN